MVSGGVVVVNRRKGRDQGLPGTDEGGLGVRFRTRNDSTLSLVFVVTNSGSLFRVVFLLGFP